MKPCPLLRHGIMTGSFFELKVTDPGNPSRTIARNVDNRTMEGFIVQGLALTHKNEFLIETFAELQTYHQPDHVYRCVSRKCYNLPTYGVALAVCRAHPAEPFESHHIDRDMQFTKLMTLKPMRGESHLIHDFCTENKIPGFGGSHVMPDGLITNSEATGFMTSFDTFQEQEIRKWHSQMLFLHYFQAKSVDATQAKYWKGVFSKKVLLYVGFRSPTLTDQQIAFARGLNIRPLVKRGLQSFLC